MYPTLFKIGNTSVSSFTVMLIIAILVGYMIGLSEFKRKGLSENLVNFLLGASVTAGLIGAKILFIFQNATIPEFVSDPIRYLATGFTWFGALLSCILIWVITARWKKINFWLLGDAVAPPLILAYGIGRIGCLLVGDDFGVPSNLPWAISFPNGFPPNNL